MSSTGVFYAAKDMLDPTGGQGLGGRRLYWGWTAYVSPAQGQMSLPREVTWHPELQQLVHSPLPEMAGLRVEPALASPSRIAAEPRSTGRARAAGGLAVFSWFSFLANHLLTAPPASG